MSKFYTHITSPNYEARKEGTSINFLILHYTGCDLEASLQILTDTEAVHRVSAHYLIDEKGDIFYLVDEEHRAWHAGESSWKGLSDINSRSVGIEIVNPGIGSDYRPFPPAQMESVLKLSKEIVARHLIPPPHVLGHSDIAPERKIDPGFLFDWKWLASHGVGVYPSKKENLEDRVEKGLDVTRVQDLLAQYGYALERSGILDAQTRAVIRAFQMHFCPESLGQEPDNTLVHLLESLHNQG